LALLRGELGRGGQVLQRASAAHAEVRTPWHYAIRGCDQDLDQARFVHVPAPLDDPKPHAFIRQCAVYEHRLAVESRDPAAIMSKIHDVGLLHRPGI
jgi:hypothetical protein